MKKIAFVLLLLTMLFSSCSKEGKPYVIHNSMSGQISLNVYECTEAGDCVNAFRIYIDKGQSKHFASHDMAVKVKLEKVGYEKNYWVQQVFYLKKGTTNIDFHELLLFGSDEPCL